LDLNQVHEVVEYWSTGVMGRENGRPILVLGIHYSRTPGVKFRAFLYHRDALHSRKRKVPERGCESLQEEKRMEMDGDWALLP
jgi:hypothetical protein